MCKRIHADNVLTTAPITIQASSGVVVLSGTVETDATRSAAENAAKQADGVKNVVNNLQLVTIASAAKAAEVVSERRTPKPKPIVAKAAKAPKAAVPEKAAEPAAPTNR
jgi:hypothetical protein